MIAFFLLTLAASLIILIFLIARLWGLRHAPGALELLLSSLACGIWSFGYALEILLPGFPDKVLWAKFQYFGIATVTVWVLLFILRYIGRSSGFNIRHTAVLLFIPALTILFTYTNGLHAWMWTSIAEQSGWNMAPLALGHGGWFWVEIGYSYLLLVGGTILFIQHFFHIQRHYRPQALVMLVAIFAPWVGNALYILGLRPGPNLDLTPLAFTFTNIGLVLGFMRFKLLDILPVAYSSIFKFMSDGVVVIDANQRVIDMNPAAQQIFSRPYLSPPTQPLRQKTEAANPWIGQPLIRLLPSYEIPANSRTPLDEKELRFNGGEWVYALRTTPIINQRQQVTGQVLIFTDITRLKRAEEELKTAHQLALESNRMKTQLLANVSHDMRTPLGAIIGFSDMLNEGIMGEISSKQKDTVIEIQDSANQLLLFVNNLIGQAQFDTGRILIKPKHFDSQELIDACQLSVRLPASRKGLCMIYKLEPGFPEFLYSDLFWLRQIAINLISNAVKFTDQGSVTFRLYQPDPLHWGMDIADTGPGISTEAQATIFEPFRQVDSPSTSERGGSGLGLAIVKELAGLMNGQVSLVSQPGAGSTFTVLFGLLTKDDDLPKENALSKEKVA